MLFIDTVNKAFFPSNCTLVRHSLQNQNVLFQLALNPCILVSHGIGCLSKYWWQLMKISTRNCFHGCKWKDTLKWIFSYYCCLQTRSWQTLHLNISSSLGTTVLGKETILFLIKDNSFYLIMRKSSCWTTVFHLMNKVIRNINRVLLLSFKNIWSKIWKYISNNKVKTQTLEKYHYFSNTKILFK